MFDIHQSIHDKHGEQDERLVSEYIDGLLEAFAASPEAQPIIEQQGDLGAAAMMMEYYFDYIGGNLAEMTLPDFKEVVFELFPSKVSMEPDRAAAYIAELKAFWAFVHRQYGLKTAERILATLDDTAAERLRKLLADPSNYGMAKSFFMAGMRAGYDMTTQEGSQAFMQVYNARILANPLPEPPKVRFDPARITILPPPRPELDREKKRKERKRQRQARKRNRK
jgi:hypothetical protein